LIIIWVTYFALLGLTWVFWDPTSDAILAVLDYFTARFPTYFTNDTATFIRSIVHWFPAIVVIGGLVWVIVASQRTSPEGYYYG
jgi:hypothetical protein